MLETLSPYPQHRYLSSGINFLEKIQWRPGPVSPEIESGDVHVWRVSLDTPSSVDADEILSEDERVKAARFHFERDRRRFIKAHSALRIILARYPGMPETRQRDAAYPRARGEENSALNCGPAELEFELNGYGKPSLVSRPKPSGLRFNLSHSHGIALIALTRDREVGVDIEFMRPDFAGGEVAEHFFSPLEVAQLDSVSPALRTEAFFNCWTRKEAYIKARGEGLSLPLAEFDVTLIPDSPAAMVGNRLDPGEVSRWAFQELFPAADYAATFAVEGGYSQIRLWDFNSGVDDR